MEEDTPPLSGKGAEEDGVVDKNREVGAEMSNTPSTTTRESETRDPLAAREREGGDGGRSQDEDKEGTWHRGDEYFMHPYVVWCNWAHSLEAQPYAVCVDPVAEAVVLTIRGSMSGDDAITDCFVDEERIPAWAGGGTGHGAMVRCAILILKELGP